MLSNRLSLFLSVSLSVCYLLLGDFECYVSTKLTVLYHFFFSSLKVDNLMLINDIQVAYCLPCMLQLYSESFRKRSNLKSTVSSAISSLSFSDAEKMYFSVNSSLVKSFSHSHLNHQQFKETLSKDVKTRSE